MVKKVYAWKDHDNGELKLTNQNLSVNSYKGGGAFRELYPIVKAESWLKIRPKLVLSKTRPTSSKCLG